MGIFNRKNGEQDRSQFEFEDSFAKSEQIVSPSAPTPPVGSSPANQAPPSQNSGNQNTSNQNPSGQAAPKAQQSPKPSTGSPTTTNHTVQPNAAEAAMRSKKRMSYSIEDAILLMRDLPSDQRDMVVSIVQKTLSSANISVNDILDDATQKLNRLGSRKSQLSKEIAELESGIKERQTEIEKISKDSEETETVKMSFEAASGMKPSVKKEAMRVDLNESPAANLSTSDFKSEAATVSQNNGMGMNASQNNTTKAQSGNASATTPPGIPSNNAS